MGISKFNKQISNNNSKFQNITLFLMLRYEYKNLCSCHIHCSRRGGGTKIHPTDQATQSGNQGN